MRRRCRARALGCCLFGPAARERSDVNPPPDWMLTLMVYNEIYNLKDQKIPLTDM